MASLSEFLLSTASNMLAGKYINAQTGTTYTPVAADAGCLITLSNTSAIAVTIPLNASVAYQVGTVLLFENINTGLVTIAGDGGVTVNSALGISTLAQYEMAILFKTATDTWLLAVLSPPAVIPQNSQSAAYTTVLADAGKHILHPTADNNARTFTIDSNANVPYRVGTTITFVNQINTVTIAITSDTLVWAEDGTTGSRSLAAAGIATALKIASTTWLISGVGLT